MKTISVKLYAFDELCESAKAKARKQVRFILEMNNL